MSEPIGTTLMVNPGTTADGVEPLVKSYQWELDGVPVNDETSLTYTTTAAGNVTCVETVTDDAANAISAETAAIEIVAASPPTGLATITYAGTDQDDTETEFWHQARPFGSEDAWTTYGTSPALAGVGLTFEVDVDGHPFNSDLESRTIAVNGGGTINAYDPIRVRTVPESAPAIASVSEITHNSATVTITPPTPEPINGGYRVYYRVVGATPWTLGATIASGATTGDLTGLDSETDYETTASAYNANDGEIGDAETGLSAAVAFETAAAPGMTLLAEYLFEETGGTVVNDSSGNGLHGTLVNANPGVNFVFQVDGAESGSKCFYANGLTSSGVHVDLGNPPELQIVGEIEIEAWVNPNAFPGPGETRTIFSKGLDDTNEGWTVAFNNFGGVTKLVAGSYSVTNDIFYGTEWVVSGWTAGTWRKVNVLYNGTAWKILINGIEVASTDAAMGALPTAANACIWGEFMAAGNGGYGRGLEGLIDNLKISGLPT